jgi:hypothetical protein
MSTRLGAKRPTLPVAYTRSPAAGGARPGVTAPRRATPPPPQAVTLVTEPQQARKRRRVVILDSIEEAVGEGAFVAGAAVNAFASQPSEVVEEPPRRRVAFARAVASVAANAAVELKEDVSRAAATGGPAQSRKRPRGGADNAELASLACMFQEVRPPSASCAPELAVRLKTREDFTIRSPGAGPVRSMTSR